MDEFDRRPVIISEWPLVQTSIIPPERLPVIISAETTESVRVSFLPDNTATYHILSEEILSLLRRFEVEEIVLLGARPFSLENPNRNVDRYYIENSRRFFLCDVAVVPPQIRTPASARETKSEDGQLAVGHIWNYGREPVGTAHKHPGTSTKMSSHIDEPWLKTSRYPISAVVDARGETASLYLREMRGEHNFHDRFVFPNILRDSITYDPRGNVRFERDRAHDEATYFRCLVDLKKLRRPEYREYAVGQARVFELDVQSFNPGRFSPSSERIDIY